MTDLKKYDKQTINQLIIGGILIIFIIGDGLIYLIYGAQAAGMGLLCLGVGLLPILLIMLVIWFMEWIVKRANKDP
jgi:hypothetical protein